MQAMISDGIIAALDGYRDLRDRSMEQIFLGIYSSPVLQALVGLRASDEPPRRRPGSNRSASRSSSSASPNSRLAVSPKVACAKRRFAAWSTLAWRDPVSTSAPSRRYGRCAPNMAA